MDAVKHAVTGGQWPGHAVGKVKAPANDRLFVDVNGPGQGRFRRDAIGRCRLGLRAAAWLPDSDRRPGSPNGAQGKERRRQYCRNGQGQWRIAIAERRRQDQPSSGAGNGRSQQRSNQPAAKAATRCSPTPVVDGTVFEKTQHDTQTPNRKSQRQTDTPMPPFTNG
ncbi:hypothetical protein [Oceaniradius stylonematis]|uniref:hypothetical protein n=1 Tax=Oceaniradius stylonematis TaxID=2184161 RepID=UPI00273EB804|nr:hypothetical protein [Oceaniradius stylonematis]